MTLQEWMDLKGMNDAALAKALRDQISRSQISRIRRGKCRPTIPVASLLAAETKIPADDFVMGRAA